MSYSQPPPGYQRPGSTASFAGQPAPPPPYGGVSGYQPAAPQAQSQWASPPGPSQQWNQNQAQAQAQAPQQNTGGYNPGVYGAMPGAYAQGQQAPANPPTNQYPTQQQDVPPPPPPKPAGFAAAVQQQQQQQQPQQNVSNWSQPSAYGATSQQGFAAQGQQGGYPQQQYNNAAPPPPSQTPGGSYFPPPQGRPQSIYGADQAGTYSTPSSAVAQHPPTTILSPNEQQPAYIPPSLTGQGVQSYMPANTNPMPGVYVPPPPDIPAWQQAQHAPLQGGNKKFRYTKPSVDPSFYAQGYQGVQPQPQGQFVQPLAQPQGQSQYEQQLQQQQQQQPMQQQQNPQFGQAAPVQYQQQSQPQQDQFGQPQQGQYMQPSQQNQFQSQQMQSVQYPHNPSDQIQQPQPFQQQQSQWQSPPATQGYNQQQNVQTPYGEQQPNLQQEWQPGHQAQGSIVDQQYPQGQDQAIQAPRPMNGHTGTTPPDFVSNVSPQSQPVSPMQGRHSMSFASGHNSSGLGRTSSVSSIALGALHSQRAGNKTSSPKPSPVNVPVPVNVPAPTLPRDDVSKFSALGMGGPSDWEHFGKVDEEIDDEEFFGARREAAKNAPVQLDSVELPAGHPSPPSTQGEWPSPPTQPAPLNAGIQRRDTYQPTPPPKSTGTPSRPPSQQPQQSFVMDSAIVAPVVTHSPQPVQGSQAPPPQSGFTVNDGQWAPQNQTSAQQQHQSSNSQQGFVMDDGGWAASTQARQQTPSQQHQQPTTEQAGFVMNDGGWNAPQQTPAQGPSAWEAKTNQSHIAELRAKDEAYEQLRTQSEREKADLCAKIEKERAESSAEIEKLKIDVENAKAHAGGETNILREQIEAMRLTADQVKVNADALVKEKESLIERLKEDAEGKDDVIKERESTITSLNRQLDAEKSKELPKPTPADLVSELDPWYAGSLERYIAMLRSEASELQVEGKIKVFTSFLRAESGARGLEYHNAPPLAPPTQEANMQQQIEQPVILSRESSEMSVKRQSLNIQVPQDSPSHDEFQYSPGGRPIMQAKSTMSTEIVPTQHSFVVSTPEQPPRISTSSQSTAILTPTSSVDDDMNKTPVQSPPEEPSQQQYKAYVPPGITQADSAQNFHRQSISYTTLPHVAPLQMAGASKNNDEIFFGTHKPQPTSKTTSRPATSGNVISDVPIPAPLSFTPHPPSKPVVAKRDPLALLSEILPTKVSDPKPSAFLEEIRKKASAIPSDFSYIDDLTKAFEKSASLTRRKCDDARRKRQEDNEAETDDLFNGNEISYAEIGAIEDDFKEKERALKAKEDRDEYATYVSSVFDKVYDGLQADIKTLMDLYDSAENSAVGALSGLPSLESKDGATSTSDSAPTAHETLALMKELHNFIELRHEKVVQAVAERDKRYKKTEIQPLYAAGNIAKMKTVERHFEAAEKQAGLRAAEDKATRVGELVHVAEDVVVHAVATEQQDVDRILDAVRAIQREDKEQADVEVFARAHNALLLLRKRSKMLLELFMGFEIELNAVVLGAEIAQVRSESGDAGTIEKLEKERDEGEARIIDEFKRKVGVIEQDGEEIGELFAGVGKGKVEEKGGEGGEEELEERTEEQEKEARLKKALEAAKRRNGEL